MIRPASIIGNAGRDLYCVLRRLDVSLPGPQRLLDPGGEIADIGEGLLGKGGVRVKDPVMADKVASAIPNSSRRTGSTGCVR